MDTHDSLSSLGSLPLFPQDIAALQNQKTLRDEFAMAATEADIDAAIPNDLEECERIRGIKESEFSFDHQTKMRAWARYAYADSMLERRKA